MSGWIHPEDVWELYSQKTYWRDQTGTKRLLNRMDDRYLGNVKRFIERHGPAHCLSATWLMNPPRMNGEEAQRIAEQAVMEMIDDLIRWSNAIEDAPLYKAVCSELANRLKVSA